MRMKAPIRRKQLLQQAVKLSRLHGYQNVTRQQVAEAAECSTNLITYHLGHQIDLQNEIMHEAISQPDLLVLAQGIVRKDPIALNASERLKNRAIRSLAK